jgi:putative transposase
MTLEYKLFYSRHLPHYQPPGSRLFITFRLAGSLPIAELNRLIAEQTLLNAKNKVPDPLKESTLERRNWKYMFGKLDEILAGGKTGPNWLSDHRIASMLAESFHFCDHRQYELDAYCIMPNHVHLACLPNRKEDETYFSLAGITQTIKGYTARKANQILNRQGAFWEHENYDHVIRDAEEYQRIITYIQMNPVKANLVDRWEKWEWTFVRT